jgi:hypothetical protein
MSTIMKRRLPEDHDDNAPAGASRTLLKLAAALAIMFVLVSGCLGSAFILWCMLGKPWPIDLSAFAE